MSGSVLQRLTGGWFSKRDKPAAADWQFTSEAERQEAEVLSREIDRKLALLTAQADALLAKMGKERGH